MEHFVGTDINSWIEHFKFSNPVRDLLEELGVKFVSDLDMVYEDEDRDLLPQFEKVCPRVEYRRFINAKDFTNKINLTSVAREEEEDSFVRLPTPPSTSLKGKNKTMETFDVPLFPPAAPPVVSLESPAPTTTIQRVAELNALRAKNAAHQAEKERIERELKLEMERSMILERERTETSRMLHATQKRKEAIQVMFSTAIKDAASVDMAFQVDCTGSMSPYMRSTIDGIVELATAIKALHPFITIRFAFVGYRDHCDGANRISVLDFTRDMEVFKTFVSGLTATGGGDECEDVFGALQTLGHLPWTSHIRIVYHVADAPCHGREYHNGCGDSYPNGDPNGLKAVDLLTHLQSQNIAYFFGRINSKTDKMITVFNSLVGGTFITQETVSAGTFMETVTKSVSRSVSESVSSSSRVGDGKKAKKTMLLDPSPVNFALLTIELVSRFALQLPSSINDLMDSFEDINIVKNWADPTPWEMKIATSPFAQGATKAAYYAQHIIESPTTITGDASSSSVLVSMPVASAVTSRTSYAFRSVPTARISTATTTTTAKPVILKESLYASASELTKVKYEAFVACQRASIYLANEFNRVKPLDTPAIRFSDCCIVQFMERKAQPYFIYEEQIHGNWEKYNNNNGFCAPSPTIDYHTNHDIVQTFSHWTYHISNKKLIVVDCQGCYDRSKAIFHLTDPAIHSTNVLRFGGTNCAQEGMLAFFKSHKCNNFCTALGLVHPAMIAPPAAATTSTV